MLAHFNDLPPAAAQEALLACCASPGWAARVAGHRPYPTSADLIVTGVAEFDTLSWPDLANALAAHPRIGERPEGDSEEAAWSRREQSEVQGSAELAEANRAYEERFGYLFLIFASGKSGPEILAEARGRLGNDEETERRVVRGELRKIVELRLERLVA
ncbi:2-oxo-4-hydroxy-4-carboxy-5-ureidoimidazoline decarboxylase [Dactylosporangium sp. NPDC049742]|uniref:2-oxo-4-hydroxy-4-carboxy-5-ureidoimidazoline decarboxylase n=1 Tax=Dactylosporangium sp. NPDC049742 TaxID=3154737 RepID=UPI0034254149